MLRKTLAAATALVASAALLLVGSPAIADPPSDQTNSASYWQTPGTGEVCAKLENPGTTTRTLPAPPTGSVWTKVVIKAGNTGTSVDAENNAYVDDLTYKHPAGAPGTTWNTVDDLATTTFSHPSGKDISHVIYCWAPMPLTEVSGSASATAQTCVEGDLVGGVITVEVKTGVVYTITGPSGAVAFDAVTGMTAPLPPGSYTVNVSAASGYKVTGATSIPLTIAAYDGECGDHEEPIEVSGSASATAQTCVEGDLVGGVITVEVKTGVVYTITGPSGAVAFDAVTGMTAPLPPGSYTVAVSAESGYELKGAASIPLTIAAYGGECGDHEEPIEVTPTATVTDQTCVAGVMLVGGSITVGIMEGVSYTITGPSGMVAYHPVTGMTGELPPGEYTVDPEAEEGYVLTSDDDLIRTVGAYEGECDLVTKPLVEPAATSSAITCDAAGRITLSSDLGAGVIWTINGNPVPHGHFTVSSPGVYHVHAEPDGPEYGFADGTRQDWTFTFTDPATCELPTLALTGAHGSAAVAALAAGLGLLGAALVRGAGRRASRAA